MVAVSAARVKVVAIERFARQWRSTLTRFATTAGWRLSGNGGRVVGVAGAPSGPEGALRHKHGLAAVSRHSAGAVTPGGVAAGHGVWRTTAAFGRCLPLRRSVDGYGCRGRSMREAKKNPETWNSRWA